MTTFLRNLRSELGQDLIEYTLLMAFVALASAALFIGAGGSIKGIWGHPQPCAVGQQSTQEKPCTPATEMSNK